MEIDVQVEPFVREALTAVVKSDAQRLERALGAFPDDEAMTKGARLATAVSLYVLNDVHGGQPNGGELRAVADKLVEMEGWTDINSDEVMTFLAAAYSGRPGTAVLPVDRIAPLAYVIAGNLLSSCCKEGEFWFNYLDRAEAALARGDHRELRGRGAPCPPSTRSSQHSRQSSTNSTTRTQREPKPTKR